jgi:pyruvate/2-oxoacid:ferredoxin oxidoreductase alpha subunit
MYEARLHGRGGQGVVTAAELLSVAAFREGRYAQAFPSFGSERTGAPVMAFCRRDERPMVRYPAHHRQMEALDLIPPVAEEYADATGRSAGGLIRPYRTTDAETIVIALGSALRTIEDTVDALRDEGVRIGVVGIASFRPFPLGSVRRIVGNARRVVLQRALAVGIGGIVSATVRMSARTTPWSS